MEVTEGATGTDPWAKISCYVLCPYKLHTVELRDELLFASTEQRLNLDTVQKYAHIFACKTTWRDVHDMEIHRSRWYAAVAAESLQLSVWHRRMWNSLFHKPAACWLLLDIPLFLFSKRIYIQRMCSIVWSALNPSYVRFSDPQNCISNPSRVTVYASSTKAVCLVHRKAWLNLKRESQFKIKDAPACSRTNFEIFCLSKRAQSRLVLKPQSRDDCQKYIFCRGQVSSEQCKWQVSSKHARAPHEPLDIPFSDASSIEQVGPIKSSGRVCGSHWRKYCGTLFLCCPRPTHRNVLFDRNSVIKKELVWVHYCTAMLLHVVNEIWGSLLVCSEPKGSTLQNWSFTLNTPAFWGHISNFSKINDASNSSIHAFWRALLV